MLMKENLNNYLLEIIVIFILQHDPKGSRENKAENAEFW